MPPKRKGAEAASAPKSAGKRVTEPSRSELAAALMADINQKSRGRAELVLASSLSMPYITKRLPTGLLTIDIELRGGLPAAGVSQIVGPKNSCKTYLYWQVIRQLQETITKDKTMVLLAMTELRADRTQARLSGVKVALADEDINALDEARVRNGWPPFSAEEREDMKVEVGTIHELHAESAELLFDGILRAVDQNIYHLIVLDSIGSVMSEQEAQTESLTEKTYGGAAKPITEFLRKLTALLTMRDKYGRTRDTCVIVINQIRDNIGDPNKEWRTTGGRALEHAKFVDLYVRSGKLLGEHVPVYGPSGTSQRFMPWGKEIYWEIIKGKAGIHEGGRGTFVFDYRLGGADYYLDTLVAGVRNGVVEQSGAWFSVMDEDGDEMLRAQGKEAFVKALIADAQESATKGEESVMNYIRSQCYKKNDINVTYRWG